MEPIRALVTLLKSIHWKGGLPGYHEVYLDIGEDANRGNLRHALGLVEDLVEVPMQRARDERRKRNRVAAKPRS